jgi:alpha-tubulin suppressor-like RCC1 family protein
MDEGARLPAGPADAHRIDRETGVVARAIAPALFAVLFLVAACSDSTGPGDGEITDGRLFLTVEAGGDHTCGVTGQLGVVCWGGNGYGELGDGSDEDRFVPVPVAANASFETVSAGESHTCALTSEGKAFCWGSNGQGQLGIGLDWPTAPRRTAPAPVATGLLFTAISAGGDYTCAIDTDERLHCWGSDRYGQLGTGTDDDHRLEPAAVDTQLRFTSVSAGYDHTCAVDTQGRAHCWGGGSLGQLGAPTQETCWEDVPCSRSPLQVSGEHTWKSISVGDFHTCGVTTEDRAFCWGDNQAGELGASTEEVCGWPTNPDQLRSCSTAPVSVSGSLSFQMLEAGNLRSCGVSTQGTVYCWGVLVSGDPTPTPVAIPGPVPFRSVSTGSQHACAVGPEGIAYCWGSNDVGQLGAGIQVLGWPEPIAVRMW